MDRKHSAFSPKYQEKYRQQQSQKGLVRYEIQVSREAKARFEAAVTARADEYPAPYSERARKAKARSELFEEITQDVVHEFFALKERIQALEQEIQALAPKYFKTPSHGMPPIPQAIASLPNDPEHLKALLAKSHLECQNAKLAVLSLDKDLRTTQGRLKQQEDLLSLAYSQIENIKKGARVEYEEI